MKHHGADVSRKNVDKFSISINGGRPMAVIRTSYSTGGQDPTVVVSWKSEGPDGTIPFETYEFQGDLSGTMDGQPMPEDVLSYIHNGLEGLVNAINFIQGPEERDPMGRPEDYE